MGMLLFKKEFWDSIRSGRKRTTVRRWNWPRVRSGARVFAPGIGWLVIERVEVVHLNHLTREDARADGFASRDQMRRALRRMYRREPARSLAAGATSPAPAARRRWFRITFRREATSDVR